MTFHYVDLADEEEPEVAVTPPPPGTDNHPLDAWSDTHGGWLGLGTTASAKAANGTYLRGTVIGYWDEVSVGFPRRGYVLRLEHGTLRTFHISRVTASA